MTDDSEDPRLTDYAELHGCSCKVGRADLEALLTDADLAPGTVIDGDRVTPEAGVVGDADDATAERRVVGDADDATAERRVVGDADDATAERRVVGDADDATAERRVVRDDGLGDDPGDRAGAGDDNHSDLLAGVGEDAAARLLAEDLALVQTVDFFTPIVDDPFDFGRVAAANACSDAFATGATENLSLLAVLGIPREVTEHAPAILAGMQDVLAEVDGVIVGGHTTLNPWPIAGGAVTATAAPEDLLMSCGAAPGHRLLLTKPLGTQPAMGALRVRDGEFAATVAEATDLPIEAIGAAALDWMTTPNLAGARAAGPYASAATDVTGFGLLGQARTLAARSGGRVVIDRLPVVEGTPALSRLFGYGLAEGESAETSGGLLLSVPGESLAALEDALEEADVFHREVGRVVAGEGAILEDPTVEEVPL